MKPKKIPTPETNLLGHQHLLAWYKGIEQLQIIKTLCPIMLRVPGECGVRTTLCDIPQNRALYLYFQVLFTCRNGDQCLPRAYDSEPGGLVSNELVAFYRPSSRT